MPQAPTQHRIPGFPASSKTQARKSRPKERRGSAASRGYGTRWRRFRDTFIKVHPVCEYCEANGKTVPANVVDHDIPHRGCPVAFWNTTFTALCDGCHNGPKARAEARLDDEALLRWVAARKTPRGGGG